MRPALVACFVALAVCRFAAADLILLDEYWTPEITVTDVAASEVDTRATGDPSEARFGEFSARLENTTGSPNVRFRSAALVRLDQFPPELTEGRIWCRTDRWTATWRFEIWVWWDELPPAPVKVLEGVLDGGGENGRLIADDQWHQARGVLRAAEAFGKVPQDKLLPTYVWLAPESGWNVAHRTYVDRAELVVTEGPLKGTPPEPVRHVRPRPGTQTNGPGWVWLEGEDAVETNVGAGGALMPSTAAEQAMLSNGAWLQWHGSRDLRARWEVSVPETGAYSVWYRGMGEPFSWRCDGGEWQATGSEDAGWVDEVEICKVGDNVLSVLWLKVGDVQLAAGRHTLEALGTPEEGHAFSVDCWLLTRGEFTPHGIDKPAPK
jgi:hypothetical protein